MEQPKIGFEDLDRGPSATAESLQRIILGSPAYRIARTCVENEVCNSCCGREPICSDMIAGSDYHGFTTGGIVNVRHKFYGPEMCESCVHRFRCLSQILMRPEDVSEGLFTGELQSGNPVPLRVSLPRFVPMINPMDRRTYAHCYSAFPYLVVQVDPFFRSRAERQKACQLGIHDYMQYDGIVVLSSIVHDRFLSRPNIIKKYLEIVHFLEPDVAVTLSHSAYTDDPCFVGANAVLWSIRAATLMSRLDLPLIGLVVGSTDEQITLCTEAYRTLGYVDFALSCRGLLLHKRVDLVSRWVRIIKKCPASCLLLGASHPNLFHKLPQADSYSGLAWFHNAVNGKKYVGSACVSGTPCDHCKRQDLVGHNLTCTVQAAESVQRTMEYYCNS